MSQEFPESLNPLDGQAIRVDMALEQASSYLEQAGETDVLRVVNWIKANNTVGYATFDPPDYNFGIFTREGNKITTIFVEEGDTLATHDPRLREQPAYLSDRSVQFAPTEALAHPAVLACTLLHTGIYAYDKLHQNPSRAERAVPEVKPTEAACLWSATRVFEFEGKLLGLLLGSEFSEYLNQMVARAIKGATAQNRTLGFRVMSDTKALEKALADSSHELSPEERRYALRLMVTVVSSYTALSVVNAVMSKLGRKPTEVEKMRTKIRMLHPTLELNSLVPIQFLNRNQQR